jgi:Tfp pilus assembly protein PilO
MKLNLFRIRQELGSLGMAALLLTGAAAAFSSFVVEPIEKRNQILTSNLKSASRAGTGTSGQKVEAVYQFLDKDAETTDWLAKLYGIGKATGVELKSATYKTHAEAGRVERYEIVLPAAGSYTQIRDFLKRALTEIPVLSLDQMTLRRESRTDGSVNAELRLTLHKVKS